MTPKQIHPVLQLVLAAIFAAGTVAVPLVDDGVTASEALSILLAGIAGTGLVAVTPTRKSRGDQ